MERLWNSILDTADNIKDIELCFYVDDDDDSGAWEMAEKLMAEYPDNIKAKLGPRICLSKAWNECYEISTGPIYHHCGDDIVFVSKGWDKIVKNQFNKVYPDKIALVFGRDHKKMVQHKAYHGWIHKKWVKACGYFLPPYFSAEMNDIWLTDVAKMVGRKVFIKDIQLNHMHYNRGLAEFDQTYQDLKEFKERDNVKEIYKNKIKERRKNAKALKEVINQFKGKKIPKKLKGRAKRGHNLNLHE
jgi:hypothetical protein